MTDLTQGADAPDDSALFNEAVSTDTLAKFENPALPETPVAPKADEPPAPQPKEEPKPDDTAPVPAGRLREEADARRKAERERDDLQRRLDGLTRPPPPQPQAPQQVDMFENPQGFVQQQLRPVLEQVSAHFASQLEELSKENALGRYGAERVDAAYQALALGMQRHDPEVAHAYNRIMASADRYGAMVRWHQSSETMRSIGGDLEAYKQRHRSELLQDPEFLKQALEAAKGQAKASGNVTARPVTVASSPSLGNVGAAGGDPQMIEPDDMTLFRAATQAKRR